ITGMYPLYLASNESVGRLAASAAAVFRSQVGAQQAPIAHLCGNIRIIMLLLIAFQGTRLKLALGVVAGRFHDHAIIFSEFRFKKKSVVNIEAVTGHG